MTELEKIMYFNTKLVILEAARILRNNMTKSEKILWDQLRGKQILGLCFRRQHPIDIFIADFYCHEVRLVVEIDGEIHNHQKEYDDGREAEMEKQNIKTVRFKKEEVENNIEKVILEIKNLVNERLQSQPR